MFREQRVRSPANFMFLCVTGYKVVTTKDTWYNIGTTNGIWYNTV